jgi:hypothetical protein
VARVKAATVARAANSAIVRRAVTATSSVARVLIALPAKTVHKEK